MNAIETERKIVIIWQYLLLDFRSDMFWVIIYILMANIIWILLDLALARLILKLLLHAYLLGGTIPQMSFIIPNNLAVILYENLFRLLNITFIINESSSPCNIHILISMDNFLFILSILKMLARIHYILLVI